jgi:pyruvate carboxylase subunit B
MKKIDFMLTAFRDGFQSVYGARVFSKDYLPVVKACADAGITHFEAGGGALFQSHYFYSNEDSFAVMDAFREAAGPKANLQTLARGINVVGLDSQSSDIIKLHAQLFKKHGMTTIRNFDALNDVQNLIYSGRCIVEAGLKHEVVVTMMELPPGCEGAHTPEFYAEVLKRILDADIPYDSVCFKDASGTSRPRKVYDTIKAARKLLGPKTRIVFHSHETAGTGTVSYVSAVEAGADQVDLSMAPCSGGTCQPDVITMWHALRGTDYTLDIDINRIIALEETFKEAMSDYMLPPEATRVEPLIPFFPMPGGALTANTQMLRDNKLLDKYPEVIKAMGESVAKGGFGTSVTPVSQFYFQQAFNNVMFGPWKKIAEGYGKMVLGYFGKTPVEPDAEVVKIAQAQLNLPPTTESPLAINDRNPKKGIAPARKLLEENHLQPTAENLFIAATCQDKGILFLKGQAKPNVRKLSDEKAAQEKAIAAASGPAPKKSEAVTVTVNNRSYGVKIAGNTVVVNGLSYNFQVQDGIDSEAVARTAVLPKSAEEPGIAETKTVESPLPGLVLRTYKKAGEKVAVGETVVVLESMKMETPINSGFSGIITELSVHQGDQVDSGQKLFKVSTLAHGSMQTVARAAEAPAKTAASGSLGLAGERVNIESPLPGLVLRIYKEPGERVNAGESILVLESMKMETPINSSVDGVMDTLKVKQGDQIQSGQVLAVIRK